MNNIPKKHLIIFISSIVVALILGFLGGSSMRRISSRETFGPGMMNGNQNFGGRGNTPGGRMMGSAVSGEVISKDATSLTVKLPNGGSRIVLFSDNTTVAKAISGTQQDITSGSTIFVTGITNPDGSVTAQNIQIRPAGTIGDNKPQ